MSAASAVSRLVIVGGGPSGLTAAWKARETARNARAPMEIVVLEADDQVGGKARTEHVDGLLIETGPQGYLDDQPVLREIVTACGLEDETIAPEPDANRRYIYRGGRLRELSRHPAAFVRSGLLGPLGLLRLAMEPLTPRRQHGADDPANAGEDESLFDFAARRMGRQAARRLISPVVLGIFAGDARELSAAAALPRLIAMERAHGSLFRAMRAGRRRGAVPPGQRSFVRGIQSLPRAIAELPGIDVRCSSRVTTVARAAGGNSSRFVVTLAQEELTADAVVVAADLPAAADLVEGVSTEAAQELRQIDSPPIAVVHAAFEAEAAAAARIEPAYGFLVARGEGIRMLGCQYESATFRGRAPERLFLVRCLFGGSVDRDAADLGDARLVDLTLRELRQTVGIDAPPAWTGVARWPHAIPQYATGHPRRAARIAAALDPVGDFHLAGNALHGVGLSRAIAVGADCGERAARSLLQTRVHSPPEQLNRRGDDPP